MAYSSIEHMGIVALGIGFRAPLATAGALLHVITHASAKGLAFLGAGSLLRGYDTKEVAGGFANGGSFVNTGLVLLLIFVCVAFFGVIWHTGRMGLSRPAGQVAEAGVPAGGPRERSAWMIAGMAGCLFVLIALGVHMPGDLAALLSSAGHTLRAGRP